MTAHEWGLIIALAAIWGGSFFFIAVAVKALPPFTLVFLRCAIGALGLFAVLLVLRQRVPFGWTALSAFAGMAILNNIVPQSLIIWAQGALTSGHASILNATTPFFTVLILHLGTSDQKASPAKWLGVVVGFVGVACMMGLDVLAGASAHLPQQAAMLAATFSYGLSGWWSRRIARLGIPPIAAAAGQLTLSSLMSLPLVMLVDRPWLLPMPATHVWLAVLGLALVSTALAYVVFFRILATAGATNLSLTTFLIPVSAIVLGIVFLGETLHVRHLAGMACIGLGLAIIDGRPWAALTARPA